MRSLDADWNVSFTGVAAPAETQFEKLVPWNEHPDEAIRYFSGTGLYAWLIRTGTGSDWSHVGIAYWISGRLLIFESIEGHGVRIVRVKHTGADPLAPPVAFF